MELLPAVTAWLDSRTRVLKKQVTDLVTDPVGHVEKQAFNALEDASNFVDKSREDPMAWVEVLAGNGMVGAFRPVGSKLLPSAIAPSKSYFGPEPIVTDPMAQVAWRDRFTAADATERLINDKLTPKVLEKYGASDFPLDAYLGHVKGVPEGDSAAYFLRNLNIKQMDQPDMRRAIGNARARLQNPFGPAMVRSAGEDLRAIGNSLKYKTPLYDVNTLGAPSAITDITAGIMNLTDALASSPYTPDQLSKKSLQQLVSVGLKSEKDRAAAQLKEASVIKDFTIQRSAKLNQEQGLPKGFVELKTQQDLGAETEFMNNCVGAGGAHPQTGKFIPKWHPITGEQITKGFAEDSGDQYWKRLQSGNERIFSYRPEGLPVATIRMDTKTGDPLEVLGVNNIPVPDEFAGSVKSFVADMKAKVSGIPAGSRYKRAPEFYQQGHNIPFDIEQLLRPRGDGAVQLAAWEAEHRAARNAAQPAVPRDFLLGDL